MNFLRITGKKTYKNSTSFRKFRNFDFSRHRNFHLRQVGRISCLIFDSDSLHDQLGGPDDERRGDRVGDFNGKVESADVVGSTFC